MFGSSILEVAIGVIFIYLLLSLICSVVNEFISATINKRGENLFEGIKNLLNDPTFTGLAQKVYNHGLVDGISQASKNPNKPNRRPSYIDKKTFALALMDNLSSLYAANSWQLIADQRKAELAAAKVKFDANPRDAGFKKTFYEAQRALAKAQELLSKVEEVKHAYDDAEYAASRVVSPKDMGNLRTAKDKLEKALTLGRMLAAELPDPLDNVRRAISILPEGHTKQSLYVMANKAEQAAHLLDHANTAAYEMELLQENIEKWFDDAMDRVGGWYKRWTQQVLLGISVILVLVANVDTIMLIKRLGRDNALRASIVTAANSAIQVGDPSKSDIVRADLLEQAGTLNLPVGWVYYKADPYRTEQVPDCKDVTWSICLGNWVIKLIGLLISMIAIQLGAPFWFDTLSKFINIRSAGTPPGESAKSGPQPARKEVSPSR